MPDAAASTGLSDKLQNKRKRQADDSSKQEQSEGAATNAEGSNKKKQKKNKKNKKKTDQDGEQSKKQDDKEGIDESIGKMDGRLLGDHFAQKAKRLDKQLSAVELSDLSVPGAYTHYMYIW